MDPITTPEGTEETPLQGVPTTDMPTPETSEEEPIEEASVATE